MYFVQTKFELNANDLDTFSGSQTLQSSPQTQIPLCRYIFFSHSEFILTPLQTARYLTSLSLSPIPSLNEPTDIENRILSQNTENHVGIISYQTIIVYSCKGVRLSRLTQVSYTTCESTGFSKICFEQIRNKVIFRFLTNTFVKIYFVKMASLFILNQTLNINFCYLYHV